MHLKHRQDNTTRTEGGKPEEPHSQGWPPVSVHTALLLGALAGLATGAILLLTSPDNKITAHTIWAGTTVLVLMPTIVSSVRALWHRKIGVDLISVLAMGAALALGEYLAGAIVAVMLTGGTALEHLAVSRARRNLTALLKRVPAIAHRINHTGEISHVAVSDILTNDLILIKPGEVIPADGILTSAQAALDESALTGESRLEMIRQGTAVRSGATNEGGPFELKVTSPAAESTYAGIIKLVRAAEGSKAPFVRMADQYALVFLALTVTLAAIAWAIGEGPVRALSVLVVATPCPLILAAPATIIAGISRAAKQGIIIKGGGPLETIARTEVLLLDKTGTVTTGRPQVMAVEALGQLSEDSIVQYAASLEQTSVHPFAPAIMAEARRRNIQVLPLPEDVTEVMGIGIKGRIHVDVGNDVGGENPGNGYSGGNGGGGHRAGCEPGQLRHEHENGYRNGNGKDYVVTVGQFGMIENRAASSQSMAKQIRSIEMRTCIEGSSSVYVAVDGELVGALLLEDPIRAEAPRVLRELRTAGVKHIHMVTGDHPDVADLVGDVLGFDRVYSEKTPEEKVDVIRAVRKEGVTAMVGDGLNDAPALALADVGIAMGARGATAASESADVVLTADRLEGLLTATLTARRTRNIAMQSVVFGIGLSLVAMVFATAGYITPVAGALMQEGIDILAILNALRALGGGRSSPSRRKVSANGRELALRLADDHQMLRPRIRELAGLAGRLMLLSNNDAMVQLERAKRMLENELIPHEKMEQKDIFPLLVHMLDGADPTGPLIETHHEIFRLVRLYCRLLEQLPPGGPGAEEIRDLQRVLYSLHAIAEMHISQEEELYCMFGS